MSKKAAKSKARERRQPSAQVRAETQVEDVPQSEPGVVMPVPTSRRVRPTGVSSSTVGFKAGRQLTSGPTGMYFATLGLKSLPRAAGRQREVLDLMREIRDYDADASAAVWNYLLIANSGHTVEVLGPGDKPDPDAEDYLNALAKRVWKLGGGGADTLAGTLFLAFLSYGGAGLEVELTDDLLDVEDFHPFGPSSIEFKYVREEFINAKGDKVAKAVLRMFPARAIPGVDRTPLSPIQVHYFPLMPDLDDAYGRPPLLPALHSLLSLMGIIKTLQDVAKVHGFGMRDIKVLELTLRERAPASLRMPGKEAELAGYIGQVLTAVRDAVEDLEITDTFVHLDNTEVGMNSPGGQGINLDKVIDVLGRRAKTGLKTLPIILGEVEGSTQTHGTVQWSIYVYGLRAIQGLVKRLLEAAYNTALRVRGIAGRARVEFNMIRETDRMLDANTERTEINNAREKYKLGTIDHEELSETIAGHAPKGPKPPTYADEFNRTAGAASAAASTQGASAGSTDANDQTTAPAGSDAGITEDEGAALDATNRSATDKVKGNGYVHAS